MSKKRACKPNMIQYCQNMFKKFGIYRSEHVIFIQALFQSPSEQGTPGEGHGWMCVVKHGPIIQT